MNTREIKDEYKKKDSAQIEQKKSIISRDKRRKE